VKLTTTSVYRPVVALVVTAALTIYGLLSYFTLGLEQNPELKLPIVTVQVTYPGASAQAVEEQVTRRIEDSIAGLGNIKTITSSSQTGFAVITVEFREGVNQDIAATDVQQKVASVRKDLPAEVEEPSYTKLDFNDAPVLFLALTAPGDGDEAALYRLADEFVRPRLEQAEGVGRVVVTGGRVPEVQVEVDPDKLRAHGLTAMDVTNAVRAQFMNTSGGQVKSGAGGGTRQTAITIDSRGDDVAALGSVAVVGPDGFGTELRNVARVYYGGKEPTDILRVNGRIAAGLLVYKQSSANIAQTVDVVKPLVSQLNGQLPPGYSLTTAVDMSTPVRATVAGVEHELMLAALITGVVLFFFLHSVRSTIIVLISIPVSLLVALIVMKLVGLKLNGMTLIGLTTAIGVLVDDSIVVLENIFRHLEQRKEPKQAAVEGRGEIGLAAIAITLVDVAVWGPIIFITGITGAFLRNFAVVMVAATLASLLVSFTLTPLLASRWLNTGAHGASRGLVGQLAAFWEPAYVAFERLYARLLGWSLGHRPLVLIGAAAIFGSNFLVVPLLGSEFVPEINQETVTVVGELPPGTALEGADRAARAWELAMLDHERFPEIHTAYVNVGRNETDRDARYINVTLDVGPTKERTRTSKQIGLVVAAAGEAMVPDMKARIGGLRAGGAGQPLQVRIFGNDLAQLGAVAGKAQAALADRPELSAVTNSLAEAPEATIRPDARRLMDLGMNAQAVGSSLRVAYQGAVVGRWADSGGKERDVRVRLPDAQRYNVHAVTNFPIARRGGQMITVGQVATLTTENKPTRINRVDRQRVATIGAEPNGVPLGSATTAAKSVLDASPLPSGMYWKFAGQGEEQASSFRQLIIGMGLSVVMMYLILAVLYESWLQPVLILTALPLATVGAFLGLYAFNLTISVPSMIGIVALIGLVGKNAILLVDRANDLRREGLDRTNALLQAGPSRLRPILMTSAVLILSMLPVALKLGDGGEQRAPLGAVLVGGMATSTLFTLLYVPVAYTYFDSFAAAMGRLLGWRPRRRPADVRLPTARPALLPVAGGAPSRVDRVEAMRGTRRRPARASPRPAGVSM
jgi:HAE1 family hydrophobic/amphiphilic exporter-1